LKNKKKTFRDGSKVKNKPLSTVLLISTSAVVNTLCIQKYTLTHIHKSISIARQMSNSDCYSTSIDYVIG